MSLRGVRGTGREMAASAPVRDNAGVITGWILFFNTPYFVRWVAGIITLLIHHSGNRGSDILPVSDVLRIYRNTQVLGRATFVFGKTCNKIKEGIFN